MHTVLNKRKSTLTRILGALCVLLCMSLISGAMLSEASAKGKKKRKQANRLDKQMLNSKYGLFGIRLHGNFAILDVTRESDPFMRDPSRGSSIGFGITFDKGLNELMSIRLEGLYQNKNFSAKGVNNYNLAITDRKETNTYMDFIEVPVMLVARFMKGELFRPFVAAGVYGAMLLPVEAEQDGVGAIDDPRRPFSTFDYGFVLSGGSYFVLSKGAGYLSAELRYSRGLANLADTGVEKNDDEISSMWGDTPLSRQTYNMNNLSLMVAYYF